MMQNPSGPVQGPCSAALMVPLPPAAEGPVSGGFGADGFAQVSIGDCIIWVFFKLYRNRLISVHWPRSCDLR
jgi:hypothetical protein